MEKEKVYFTAQNVFNFSSCRELDQQNEYLNKFIFILVYIKLNNLKLKNEK